MPVSGAICSWFETLVLMPNSFISDAGNARRVVALSRWRRILRKPMASWTCCKYRALEGGGVAKRTLACLYLPLPCMLLSSFLLSL